MNIFRKLKSEKGQSLVEYALILVLIAIAAIGTMTTLGSNASGKFTQVATEIGAPPNTPPSTPGTPSTSTD